MTDEYDTAGIPFFRQSAQENIGRFFAGTVVVESFYVRQKPVVSRTCFANFFSENNQNNGVAFIVKLPNDGCCPPLGPAIADMGHDQQD